jgi:hypothetical protein
MRLGVPRKVVERPQEDAACGGREDDRARGVHLAFDLRSLDADALEDVREGCEKVPGKLGLAGRQDDRQQRALGEAEHVACPADVQSVRVPVAEPPGRRAWICRRLEPETRGEALRAAEDEHGGGTLSHLELGCDRLYACASLPPAESASGQRRGLLVRVVEDLNAMLRGGAVRAAVDRGEPVLAGESGGAQRWGGPAHPHSARCSRCALRLRTTLSLPLAVLAPADEVDAVVGHVVAAVGRSDVGADQNEDGPHDERDGARRSVGNGLGIDAGFARP